MKQMQIQVIPGTEADDFLKSMQGHRVDLRLGSPFCRLFGVDEDHDQEWGTVFFDAPCKLKDGRAARRYVIIEE